MVGDLGEFAADLNSALKQAVPDFDGQVDAIPWRQEGNAIIGTLSLRSDGQNRDIRVIVPIGNGDVTVGGTAVRRGDSPMNVLYTEVVRILNPGS